MSAEKPVLLLLDANALIHRAFHAVPPLTVSRTGEAVGAVFGLAQMLLKVWADYQPTYIVAAFDVGRTFRHDQFEAYKAQRPAMPEELRGQFARTRELLAAFHIPICEVDGYEADDVLGTLARQAGSAYDTIIVTGDQDAMQLVSETVRVLTPQRGFTETKLYDIPAVIERYGVRPDQIPDLKGLKGDTSDNIPGVPGIGEKTAAKLIQQFGSIEGIYERLEEVKPDRIRELLRQHEAVARQSKELATIACDIPVTLDPESARIGGYDPNQVVELFRVLEFRSLANKLPAADGIDPKLLNEAAGSTGETPPETKPITVTSRAALAELVAALREAPAFAFDTETTGTQPAQADLVGISISVEPGTGWYIPVGHMPWAPGSQAAGGASLLPVAQTEQLSLDEVREALSPFFADPSKTRIAHNGKYDIIVLKRHGFDVGKLDFDTMIAAFLVNEPKLGLKEVAFQRLGIQMTPITALIGTGSKQISMAQVNIEDAARYAAADADVSLRLRDVFEPELHERNQWRLFTEVEMPIVPVLVDMEMTGIALDVEKLRAMSRDLAQQISACETEIYELVGHRFTIGSPQQLGQVLFEELKLPPPRRTKTGYSTDAEVLQQISELHPVVGKVLEWRQLTKLKSTYVDALPALINPITNRLHTSFNQVGAVTGRVSSSDPNLQNIPVRTEQGRSIREAFTAGPTDWVLVSADYSQIELRILAHMTKDPELVRAFQHDEDIHARTAALLYGVPIDQITPAQRRNAKTVNFGVVYGISDYGLFQRTEMSRAEAGEFIKRYFETYAGIKAYLDETKRIVRERGYVETLLGRRRYIAEVKSPNAQVRQAGDRMAINMPIQGTAADIMKIAMIAVHRRLKEEELQSKLLLQVHDELLFEAPQDEVERLATLARESMSSAMQLDVPLKVDVKVGRNWGDMEPLKA